MRTPSGICNSFVEFAMNQPAEPHNITFPSYPLPDPIGGYGMYDDTLSLPARMEMPPTESLQYVHPDVSVDELVNSYEYFHILVAEGHHQRSSHDVGRGKRQCAAFRRNGGPGIKRGLFCCSRECCVPVTNSDKKSPYCSERCQTREQNLRQGRVRPNKAAITAKKGMLDALIALFRIDPSRALRPVDSLAIPGDTTPVEPVHIAFTNLAPPPLIAPDMSIDSTPVQMGECGPTLPPLIMDFGLGSFGLGDGACKEA